MFERFDKSARRAVVLAQEEARSLNHNYVGTEHLLLALIGDDGITGQALTEHGVTCDDARGHVIDIVGSGPTKINGHIRFTSAAKEVLQTALRLALEIGNNHISSEHLLLALLTDSSSVAAQVIRLSRAKRRAIVWRLAELMSTAPSSTDVTEPRFVLSA